MYICTPELPFFEVGTLCVKVQRGVQQVLQQKKLLDIQSSRGEIYC